MGRIYTLQEVLEKNLSTPQTILVPKFIRCYKVEMLPSTQFKVILNNNPKNLFYCFRRMTVSFPSPYDESIMLPVTLEILEGLERMSYVAQGKSSLVLESKKCSLNIYGELRMQAEENARAIERIQGPTITKTIPTIIARDPDVNIDEALLKEQHNVTAIDFNGYVKIFKKI